MPVWIHPTAEVSNNAKIGEGTSVWHHAQVREGVKIGKNCIIGKGVYVDADVPIGDNVKIENYVSVYHGVAIEDGVFVGPHVCFTNDMCPRAVNPDGSIKAAVDWILSKTLIKTGAAIGANSTIRCGITIGEWAMVGAGSVVTHDVPAHGLIYGNPARLHGFVCACGGFLKKESQKDTIVTTKCTECSRIAEVPAPDWETIK
ncbi:MAG: acyltransferase [Dehalococcoidales bacterium]|jgi:acetyltransferase-like isoleucine patch superfamily enzyme